jgi:hypothetical protein
MDGSPPGDGGFGSCSRYAQCPEDILVFTAAAGDVMHGAADFDRLVGGMGEDRPAGEARVLDRVDCGTGRRDLAVADRG